MQIKDLVDQADLADPVDLAGVDVDPGDRADADAGPVVPADVDLVVADAAPAVRIKARTCMRT